MGLKLGAFGFPPNQNKSDSSGAHVLRSKREGGGRVRRSRRVKILDAFCLR